MALENDKANTPDEKDPPRPQQPGKKSKRMEKKNIRPQTGSTPAPKPEMPDLEPTPEIPNPIPTLRKLIEDMLEPAGKDEAPKPRPKERAVTPTSTQATSPTASSDLVQTNTEQKVKAPVAEKKSAERLKELLADKSNPEGKIDASSSSSSSSKSKLKLKAANGQSLKPQAVPGSAKKKTTPPEQIKATVSKPPRPRAAVKKIISLPVSPQTTDLSKPVALAKAEPGRPLNPDSATQAQFAEARVVQQNRTGQKPANRKQLDFIQALGIKVPPACTLVQATEIIVRAQNTRFFSWRVARQEWGQDLDGRALRPVIEETLRNPKWAKAIVARMDDYMMLVLDALDKDGAHSDPQKAEAEARAPDLPKDELYGFLVQTIALHHPHLKRVKPESEAITLADQQLALERIKSELEPRYYLGSEGVLNVSKNKWLGIGAAAVFLFGLMLMYSFGAFDSKSVDMAGEDGGLVDPASSDAQPKSDVNTSSDTRSASAKTPRAPQGPKPIPAPTPMVPDKAPKSDRSEGSNPKPQTEVDKPNSGTSEPTDLNPEALAGIFGEKSRLLLPQVQKALTSIKLSDGRQLAAVAAQQLAVAQKNGWDLEISLPSYLPSGPDDSYKILWPIKWKRKGASKWLQVIGHWEVDVGAGLVKPSNKDAKTFLTLNNRMPPF